MATILTLAGDGIGTEIMTQAIDVLNAVNDKFALGLTLESGLIGGVAFDETGEPLPEETLQRARAADAVLLGAVGGPKWDTIERSKRPERGLLKIRSELGLFANLRVAKLYPQLVNASSIKPEIISGLDLLIVRELTGGIYFGEKTISEDGNSASDLCEYSRAEIERITHLAFKAAQSRKRKVTLVDKANVLETSRLWRRVVGEIALEYKDVQLDFLFVDNAAMQIILNPKQFDVILTENMFGDIISDEASVIGGSIGLLASASVGDYFAMFEPIHGSYPQAKNMGIANPIASILSAAMLLDHFELFEEAELIREGVERSLKLNITTPDLNSKFSHISTTKVGDFIEDFINNPNDTNMNFTNIHLGQSTII